MSFLETDDMQEADKGKGQLSVVHEAFRGSTKVCNVCVFTFIPYVWRPCHTGNVLGRYKVHFSLEIICEPAAPVRVIDVQCAFQVSSENKGITSSHP